MRNSRCNRDLKKSGSRQLVIAWDSGVEDAPDPVAANTGDFRVFDFLPLICQHHQDTVILTNTEVPAVTQSRCIPHRVLIQAVHFM